MRRCRERCLLLYAVLLTGTGCNRAVRPLEQYATRNSATLFESGIISTDAPEFALTMSPDGRELFFNRASADRSTLAIYHSGYDDGRWSAPSLAPFSGTARDVDPFLTPKGNRLYFSSNRATASGDTALDFNTWFVERSGTAWSAPQHLAGVDSDSADVFVSVAGDGTLYLASGRDGTSRIYSSTPLNGQYQRAQVVPIDVNTAEGGSNPAIDPANRMLVFVSTRAGGSGNSDLWAACRTANGWSAAQNLGQKVNSLFADFAPSFSPDGRVLFFTSERPGVVGPQPQGTRPPGDIYHIPVSALPLQCS